MPEGEDDALRDAAAHRGLKLVKSRKRKAGVGDYGRYGLTDGDGKELFGFGPDGLTALAPDIRDYLRKAEVSTWAQSAEVTPDRPSPSRAEPEKVAAYNAEAAENGSAAAAESDDQDEQTSHPARGGKRRKQGASTTRRKTSEQPPPREPKAEPERKPEPEPEREPEPVLAIRTAAKADLDEIRTLIGSQDSAATFASRFNEIKRSGGGVIVAHRGGVIGCVAWHVILGLPDAPIGRLTLLVVADGERRQGIGRALVDDARSAMIDQGCTTIEAMSDIEVRNANGFLRALGFAQKSYRFVSDAEPKQPASG